MSDMGKVRFIRKGGRVIPIRNNDNTGKKIARGLGTAAIATGGALTGYGSAKAVGGFKQAKVGFRAAVTAVALFGEKAAKAAGPASPYSIAKNGARMGMLKAKAGTKVALAGIGVALVGGAFRKVGKKTK